MRQFLFPRAPLSRTTLLFCHFTLQLGLLIGGAMWLAPRTPWLSGAPWAAAWPSLALGGGLLLLAMVGVRLLAELWLLPHHQMAQRNGFAPSAMITRSFEQRPAVHDSAEAWTSQARQIDAEDTVLGSARVTRPRRRGGDEPTLDLATPHTPEPTTTRQEPHL